MAQHSNHVVFAPPCFKDGCLHRGVIATDAPWRIDEEIDRDLWTILAFFHSPVVPRKTEGVDLYVTSPTFADQTPHPQILFTDRDLVDENDFFPIACEKKYDVTFNVNWLPFKRHELMIEALAWAKDQGRAISCLWFGYHYNDLWVGREAMLRREILHRKIDVTFAETNFDLEVVNTRYNESRCSFNCSDYEGGPRTMTESMLANVPFVVTNDTFGGSPSLTHSTAGMVCGNSPHEIAKAIWSVIDEPQRFSPREWALHNMCRRLTLSKLRESLHKLADSMEAPINLERIDLHGYDWGGSQQLAREMESALGSN